MEYVKTDFHTSNSSENFRCESDIMIWTCSAKFFVLIGLKNKIYQDYLNINNLKTDFINYLACLNNKEKSVLPMNYLEKKKVCISLNTFICKLIVFIFHCI